MLIYIRAWHRPAAPWRPGPGAVGCPRGPSGQGLAARTHSTAPVRSRASQRVPGASPALGIWHFHGDGDGLRLGWAIGPLPLPSLVIHVHANDVYTGCGILLLHACWRGFRKRKRNIKWKEEKRKAWQRGDTNHHQHVQT